MVPFPKTKPVSKIKVSSIEMEMPDRSIREKCRQNSIGNKVGSSDVYYFVFNFNHEKPYNNSKIKL